jgi:hypothetical protein
MVYLRHENRKCSVVPVSVDPYAPRIGGQRALVKVPGLARVREWRLLTQAELSRLSGVGTNTLSRLENGGRPPPGRSAGWPAPSTSAPTT